MRSLVWGEMTQALIRLQVQLDRLGLWSEQAPEARRLASREPFCVDTLSFAEWLQWIFIPRMTVLAEQGQALPGPCHLLPMGQQVFVSSPAQQSELLEVLARIDHLAARLV